MSFIKLPISKKGETLVEVVLSMALLTIVLATSYVLSNRASSINQASNERTEVSNLMRAQAELLKAWNGYDKVASSGPNADAWKNDILSKAYTMPSGNSKDQIKVSCDAATQSVRTTSQNGGGGTAFRFNENGDIETSLVDGVTSRVKNINSYQPYAIWIEGFKKVTTTTPVQDEYVDFHIHACWERIGSQDYERSGLVVRINL